MLTAAVIPDLEGWKRKVHRVAAHALFVSLIIMVGLVVLTGNINLPVRLFSALCLLVMTTLWALVVVFKKQRHNILIHQAVVSFLFHLVVLLGAYAR